MTDDKQARTSHQRGPCTQLELSLGSEVGAISPSVETLIQFIRKCLGVPGVEEDIEIALFEALENAVVHGNHEDPGKQVRVGCRCGTDEVSIVIRDEGQGFDIDEVPDPTSPENIQSSHGRGIYLMRTRCMKFALNEVVQLSICESPPGSYDAEELVLKTADSTDMGWWLT